MHNPYDDRYIEAAKILDEYNQKVLELIYDHNVKFDDLEKMVSILDDGIDIDDIRKAIKRI